MKIHVKTHHQGPGRRLGNVRFILYPPADGQEQIVAVRGPPGLPDERPRVAHLVLAAVGTIIGKRLRAALPAVAQLKIRIVGIGIHREIIREEHLGGGGLDQYRQGHRQQQAVPCGFHYRGILHKNCVNSGFFCLFLSVFPDTKPSPPSRLDPKRVNADSPKPVRCHACAG